LAIIRKFLFTRVQECSAHFFVTISSPPPIARRSPRHCPPGRVRKIGFSRTAVRREKLPSTTTRRI
jgi:hypothetical protein